MRFLINRASEGAVSKQPPCKGAVRGPESPAWPGEYQWLIEVDSLEALITLLDETGGGGGPFSPPGGEENPPPPILSADGKGEGAPPAGSTKSARGRG